MPTVRESEPASVITFSEFRLGLAAVVAAYCGPRFHSRETAEALTDKYRQRQALSDAGVRAGCVLIRHGVRHTEVKLTPVGPRPIEVGRRLGGFIAQIVQRRTSYDMVAAALRMALGLPVTAPAPPGCMGTG